MRRGVESILPSKPHRRLKIEPVGLAGARVCGGGVRARAKCERMGEKRGKTDVEKVTLKGWRRYEEEEEKGGKEKEDNFGCVHGALR